MALTLFFLRHGETESSQSNSFCGDLDPDLTEAGQAMARDFADAYRLMPWAAILCSPLRRAIVTADPISKATGVELHTMKGLREISYGEWEGKDKEAVNRLFHDDYIQWMADPGWNAPTGGERGIDVARRTSAVLRRIERTYQNGNVLIVSHKATIRVMLCSLLGIDIGRFRDRISAPVASIAVVEMTEDGPLLRTLGDRSHLSEELRNRPGT